MWKRLRKWLRIAATAVSLLVCGLLIVLWVRSYSHWWFAYIKISNSRHIEVWSRQGLLSPSLSPTKYSFDNFFVEKVPNETRVLHKWWFASNQGYFSVIAPCWFFVTIFATIAAVPWIKWRFSLRTLLIVLTLFALFFGAIAISMRG